MTNLSTGLTTDEVLIRQKKYGENQLVSPPNKSLAVLFLHALKDPTILILLVTFGLSSAVAWHAHPDDLTEPIVILGIVLLNIFLAIREQKKAEKSMTALKNFQKSYSHVIRDGELKKVDTAKLVPGDLLKLTLGDKVPADALLIDSFEFLADEAFLTGESEPTPKNSHSEQSLEKQIFSGSFIVHGRGTAEITAIGMDTEIGKIARLLGDNPKQLSPLQIRMEKLGKSLSIVALFAALCSLAISWSYGYQIDTMIMIAISLAVAAIPEVLPVVVTLSLSFGVSIMAKQNALIRTPAAVETIGNVSVICSDKTGTLTQNKMTVTETFIPTDLSKSNFLTQFYLASDVTFQEKFIGNPTEVAIAEKAVELNSELKKTLANYKKIHEIPFSSERKKMTVLYQIDDDYLVLTKGAFDRIDFTLSSEEFNQASQKQEELTAAALRVLALGVKTYTTLPTDLSPENLETDLKFQGLIGLIDPPRAASFEAVATAQMAGIKTIMITGDHLNTAKRIATDIGILTPGTKIMTGETLAQMSEEQLKKDINDYRVFARTSPSDKIRIVRAFQENGEVVAMTGDGVNDAPALKAADVGIAMGSGTEVAKEAADIILLDDNFATIVQAIKEGRRVYQNIRKSLYAMLGCNFSAIAIVLLSLLFGFGAPVTAIQLLLIKVIADGIPGFSLSVEVADSDIMMKKPVSKISSIFSSGLLKKISSISVIFTLVTLLALIIGLAMPPAGIATSQQTAQSITFAVLGLSTIVHMYNCRSTQSLFTTKFFSNPLLVGTTFVGALFIILIVAFEPLGAVLSLVPLDFPHYFVIFLLSALPLIFVEWQKKTGRFTVI